MVRCSIFIIKSNYSFICLFIKCWPVWWSLQLRNSTSVKSCNLCGWMFIMEATWYNAYGIFRDKELYQKIFGDDEKLKNFMRWRVQILEKGIKLLNFKPGGVNAMIQITDLKNMPKWELKTASNQILALFQDNYPEMVARKVCNCSKYICFCLYWACLDQSILHDC